jgi:hypothetical protein
MRVSLIIFYFRHFFMDSSGSREQLTTMKFTLLKCHTPSYTKKKFQLIISKELEVINFLGKV